MATASDLENKYNLLRRKQRFLRNLFEKNLNQYQESLSPAQFQVLEDNYQRLTECDASVEDYLELEPDDVYIKERTEVEHYRSIFIRILNERPKTPNFREVHDAEEDTTRENNNNLSLPKVHLPKLDLATFSGDVKDWLPFWGQFKNIHLDKNLSGVIKLQYLVQATSGRPGELVRSYPPTEENYEAVVQRLKDRFASDEILIEAYVKELLTLVLNKKVEFSVLVNKIENYIRCLATLNVATDKFGYMLYPLVEGALPEDILRAWNRHGLRTTDNVSDQESILSAGSIVTAVGESKLDRLLTFLRNEVDSEERIQAAKEFTNNDKKPTATALHSSSTQRKSDNPNRFKAESSEQVKKDTCIFCSKGHLSQNCLKADTLNDRKEILKKNNACFYCLKVGHSFKSCKTFVKCLICKKRHLAIMCPSLEKVAPVEETPSSFCKQIGGPTYLQTMIVTVQGPKGVADARLLVDSGCQKSYITESLAKKLALKNSGSQYLSHGLFGGVNSNNVLHNKYEVLLKNKLNNFEIEQTLLSSKKLCGKILSVNDPLLIKSLKKLGIQLTDVHQDTTPIDIVLGANILNKILTNNCKEVEGLMAIETKLGWCVIGETSSNMLNLISTITFSNLAVSNDCVSDFWELDKIGICDSAETKTKRQIDEMTLEHFKRTVSINEQGRYEVELPWKTDNCNLPDNRQQAEFRLVSMTNKLKRAGKFQEYDSILKLWEAQHIIEPAEEADNNYYLPHRPVYREGHSTKCRPVFDASTRVGKAPSLNDRLEKGPNLIADLVKAINTFRKGHIGVTSDIEKAFLQISDLPSRGCNAKKLIEEEWYKGPKWLARPPNEWPQDNGDYYYFDESYDTVNLLNETQDDFMERLTSRFERYNKLVRVVGYIVRWKNRVQKKELSTCLKGPLTCSELKEADTILINFTQAFYFGKRVKNHSIRTFIDENGTLRVKSRLINDEYEPDFKCPIIIPGTAKMTELILSQMHVDNKHAGINIMMALIRERFWVSKFRSTVTKIVSKCNVCKRYNSKHLTTAPAPLPIQRTQLGPVFGVTGIDLAGPLLLKDGSKAYIVLFTCAVFRAIHLELIQALSTNDFINGLRRFIARRNRPKTIFTDQGSNFIGARNALDQLNWTQIKTECNQIEWIMIPPHSAWFGGFWERLVRSIKELLRRNLGVARLTYDELMTILTECEAVINSRPLTYVFSNDEYRPLTPGMFLKDIDDVETVDLDAIKLNNDVGGRYEYIVKLKNILRKRFVDEYLANLVHFTKEKLNSKQSNVKVGQIVLIENENAKRLLWPLGKTIEIFDSVDNNVRVVKLKTSKGTLVRPIEKLYPLEMALPDDCSPNILRDVCTSDDGIVDIDGLKNVTVSNDNILDCNRSASASENPDINDNELVKTRVGRQVKKPDKLDL